MRKIGHIFEAEKIHATMVQTIRNIQHIFVINQNDSKVITFCWPMPKMKLQKNNIFDGEININM